MSKLSVTAAGLTDQGKARANNEDGLWVDAARGLLIVADGMGGHQAGEIASGIAISSIPGNFEQLEKSGSTVEITDKRFSAQTNRLGFSLKMANQMIFETANRYPHA